MHRRELIAAALGMGVGPAVCAATVRCVVPEPPSPRGGMALSVRDFGAVGDGRHDDTAALRRALAALGPGAALHFGPGRFVHAARLVIAVPGVHLLGDGATLHATNPADQALLIQADGVVVRGFTLTAVTDRRRDAPWESRIAIWRDGPALPSARPEVPKGRPEVPKGPSTGSGRTGLARTGPSIPQGDPSIPQGERWRRGVGTHGSAQGSSGTSAARPIRDVHILDNRIVESGEPGSALANSSSSAAIFVHHAQRFTVARNLVRRSLADAIHVTGGSSQGRVIGNTVRESGDDMVAVVSYLPATDDRARAAPTLVRDVLIADNDLSGQYWGRGISVVGGERVTIRGNRVDATTHAAGIYIAREASFRTHGVRGVRVSGNTITRVQTTAPAYSTLEPARAGVRTGHGAIEVVAQIADDERPGRADGPALGIDGVLIDANVVHDVGTDGIRIGDGWGRRGTIERPRPAGPLAGTPQTVGITAAPVRRVTLRGNRISAVRHAALVVFNAADPARALVCEGNTLDGRPLADAACAAPARSVGATMPESTQRCARR